MSARKHVVCAVKRTGLPLSLPTHGTCLSAFPSHRGYAKHQVPRRPPQWYETSCLLRCRTPPITLSGLVEGDPLFTGSVCGNKGHAQALVFWMALLGPPFFSLRGCPWTAPQATALAALLPPHIRPPKVNSVIAAAFQASANPCPCFPMPLLPSPLGRFSLSLLAVTVGSALGIRLKDRLPGGITH